MSDSKYNYYASEFSRLKDSKYYKTLVVHDSEGTTTKHLSIHLESIPEIIAFLKQEERRLEIEELKEEKARDWAEDAMKDEINEQSEEY